MKLVCQSPRFAVYDDFLPNDEFAQLFRFVQGLDFESVHQQGRKNVWRLHDGDPLCGPGARLSRESFTFNHGNGIPALGLRNFCDRVIATVPETKAVVGEQRSAWTEVTATPWVYPAGTGLSLHDDWGYSGAYAFFLHRTWKVHWGGLLLILDGERRQLEGDGRPPPGVWLDDDAESEAVIERGLATCIFPKPNRIVFLSGSTPHMVTRVDPNAGQNVRLSIAGFFHKEDEIELTSGSRLRRNDRARPGNLMVAVATDRAELKLVNRGVEHTIFRADTWSTPALEFIAQTNEFFVHEIPGDLVDEERTALGITLVKQNLFSPL